MAGRPRAFAAALLALVVSALVVFALVRMQRDHDMPAAPMAAGIVLPQPRALPDFALVDHRSESFTRLTLESRWTVLFAGFTHCPDVCPTTLVALDAIAQRLPPDHAVNMVFLSLDPDRDTPATLADYVTHFNPRFTGVTGRREEIDRLVDALGLAYIKIPTGGNDYTIDHSAALVLIDPDARVIAYFKPPLDADRIAADLAQVAGPRR